MQKDHNPAGNKKKKHLIAIFSGVALAAGLVFFGKSEFIYVIKINNGRILAANYHLIEENWEHPRLKLLRTRENLEQVIAPGPTEFDKIVLLRKWAHSQWKGSDKGFYYPPW